MKVEPLSNQGVLWIGIPFADWLCSPGKHLILALGYVWYAHSMPITIYPLFSCFKGALGPSAITCTSLMSIRETQIFHTSKHTSFFKIYTRVFGGPDYFWALRFLPDLPDIRSYSQKGCRYSEEKVAKLITTFVLFQSKL